MTGPDSPVAHARAHLAATESTGCPREVHVVDAIPLRGVVELDRQALRARVPGTVPGADGTDRSGR